jgi:ribosomal protein L37E
MKIRSAVLELFQVTRQNRRSEFNRHSARLRLCLKHGKKLWNFVLLSGLLQNMAHSKCRRCKELDFNVKGTRMQKVEFDSRYENYKFPITTVIIWLDDRGIRVRVPSGSRIFSSPRRPDRLWGPLGLLSNGYRGLFPRG